MIGELTKIVDSTSNDSHRLGANARRCLLENGADCDATKIQEFINSAQETLA